MPFCTERLVLIAVDVTGIATADRWNYELSILFRPVTGTRWAVADPVGEVRVDDLNFEEVIPLTPGALYPSAGRPYRVRDPLLEEWLSTVGQRARALVEQYNAYALVSSLHDSAQWVFADPLHPNFASAVADVALAVPGALVVRGVVALLLYDGRWTNLERVSPSHLDAWRRKKHESADRDSRLLGSSGQEDPVPFREAVAQFEKVAAPPTCFEGSSAVTQLCSGLTAGELEPPAYINQFIQNSGLGPRTALAAELRCHVRTLHLLASTDRLNLPRIAGAEHVARRVLQMMKMVWKSPRAPDYDGLDAYLSHLSDGEAEIRSMNSDTVVQESRTAEASSSTQRQPPREDEAVHHRQTPGDDPDSWRKGRRKRKRGESEAVFSGE